MRKLIIIPLLLLFSFPTLGYGMETRNPQDPLCKSLPLTSQWSMPLLAQWPTKLPTRYNNRQFITQLIHNSNTFTDSYICTACTDSYQYTQEALMLHIKRCHPELFQEAELEKIKQQMLPPTIIMPIPTVSQKQNKASISFLLAEPSSPQYIPENTSSVLFEFSSDEREKRTDAELHDQNTIQALENIPTSPVESSSNEHDLTEEQLLHKQLLERMLSQTEYNTLHEISKIPLNEVRIPNQRGEPTNLFYIAASFLPNINMIDYLKSHGVDINFKMPGGLTPLDISTRVKNCAPTTVIYEQARLFREHLIANGALTCDKLQERDNQNRPTQSNTAIVEKDNSQDNATSDAHDSPPSPSEVISLLSPNTTNEKTQPKGVDVENNGNQAETEISESQGEQKKSKKRKRMNENPTDQDNIIDEFQEKENNLDTELVSSDIANLITKIKESLTPDTKGLYSCCQRSYSNYQISRHIRGVHIKPFRCQEKNCDHKCNSQADANRAEQRGCKNNNNPPYKHIMVKDIHQALVDCIKEFNLDINSIISEIQQQNQPPTQEKQKNQPQPPTPEEQTLLALLVSSDITNLLTRIRKQIKKSLESNTKGLYRCCNLSFYNDQIARHISQTHIKPFRCKYCPNKVYKKTEANKAEQAECQGLNNPTGKHEMVKDIHQASVDCIKEFNLDINSIINETQQQNQPQPPTPEEQQNQPQPPTPEEQTLLALLEKISSSKDFITSLYTQIKEKHLKRVKRDAEELYICCNNSYSDSELVRHFIKVHIKPFRCKEKNCGRKCNNQSDANSTEQKRCKSNKPYGHIMVKNMPQALVDCIKEFNLDINYFINQIQQKNQPPTPEEQTLLALLEKMSSSKDFIKSLYTQIKEKHLKRVKRDAEELYICCNNSHSDSELVSHFINVHIKPFRCQEKNCGLKCIQSNSFKAKQRRCQNNNKPPYKHTIVKNMPQALVDCIKEFNLDINYFINQILLLNNLFTANSQDTQPENNQTQPMETDLPPEIADKNDLGSLFEEGHWDALMNDISADLLNTHETVPMETAFLPASEKTQGEDDLDSLLEEDNPWANFFSDDDDYFNNDQSES